LDASLAEQMPRFEGVEHEVVMPDAPGSRQDALDYEELVAAGSPHFCFPELDEHAAAAMCYTSGTTGRPKGIVYSQRSMVLHTLLINQADGPGLRERDTALPIVPMFHANAWGLPYAAAMAGSKLVLPGPQTDPAALAELIAAEQVTVSAAVPTIWQGLRDPGHTRPGRAARRLPRRRRVGWRASGPRTDRRQLLLQRRNWRRKIHRRRLAAHGRRGPDR
jgi:fatty-acyl-CoA synthase